MRWIHTEKHDRVDRETMYLWVHAGLMFLGLGISLKPIPQGVLHDMTRDGFRALAILILAGSTLCLIGAAMGSRWFLPSARVDRRVPYAFAAFGQVSVVSSLFFADLMTIENADLVGTLGGSLTFAIGFACSQLASIAAKEAWRFNHKLRHPDCHWFEDAADYHTGTLPKLGSL